MLFMRLFKHSFLILSCVLLVFLAACGGVPSSLNPPPQPTPQPIVAPTIAVLTYHNDVARTGLNPNETALSPANVNVGHFGRLFSFPVDGYVQAQPLYVQNVTIPGKGKFNVLYVVTSHDTVFAFDADGKTKDPLWKVSFISPGAGINSVPNTALNGNTTLKETGITSTPVIDASTGTMYLTAETLENGNFVHKLHALDITTGAEKLGGPVVITASVPGHAPDSVNGTVTFVPMLELQRPGLLLNQGQVYLAFGSQADFGEYHGWVIAYDAATLAQKAVWCVSPDGHDGAIWMSGGGLAADAAGNVYAITANGDFDASSGGRNYSDSVLKLAADLSNVIDYFAPYNEVQFATFDVDMGSGGVLLLPDQAGAHAHIAIATNKDGNVYVVDRDNMGHFHQSDNAQILQYIQSAVGTGAEDDNFSSPAYWNGFLYFAGAYDKLKAFQVTNGVMSTAPVAIGPSTFGFQGATPSVSSNGNTGGIVWAVGQDSVLHAYDASNVANELYNSNQNQARDGLDSPTPHFLVPTVANGKVYVGAVWQVVVYGLLP